MAKVSTKGYKKNSKDKNEASLRIPSPMITMKEDDGTPLRKGPILGIDNLGNQQMMYPGMDYQFPGNYVDEIPMAKMGGTRKVKIHSLPKAQNGGRGPATFQDSLDVANSAQQVIDWYKSQGYYGGSGVGDKEPARSREGVRMISMDKAKGAANKPATIDRDPLIVGGRITLGQKDDLGNGGFTMDLPKFEVELPSVSSLGEVGSMALAGTLNAIGGIQNLTNENLAEWESPYRFRQYADDHKRILNTDAPKALYDTRIDPRSTFILQGTAPGYFSGNADVVDMPIYEKFYTAPWSVLSPEDKRKRLEFGILDGTPFKDWNDPGLIQNYPDIALANGGRRAQGYDEQTIKNAAASGYAPTQEGAALYEKNKWGKNPMVYDAQTIANAAKSGYPATQSGAAEYDQNKWAKKPKTRSNSTSGHGVYEAINIVKKEPNPNTDIAHYMKTELGLDKKQTSYSERKKLAEKYGIKDYSGSAKQNIELLNKIKSEEDPADAVRRMLAGEKLNTVLPIDSQPEDFKVPYKGDPNRRSYPIELSGDAAIDNMRQQLFGNLGKFTDNGKIPLDDPKYNPYVGGIGPRTPEQEMKRIAIPPGGFAYGGQIPMAQMGMGMAPPPPPRPAPMKYLPMKELGLLQMPGIDIKPQLGNIPQLPIPQTNKQRVVINTAQGDKIRVQDPKTKKFMWWEDQEGLPTDIENPTGVPSYDFRYKDGGALPKAQYGTQKDVERSWANSSHNSNMDIISRGNDTAPFLFGVNTDIIDTSNPNKWSWKNAPIPEPVTLDLNDPNYNKYKQWESVYNLDQQYMPWLVNRLNDPSIPLSEKSHGPSWLPGSNYNDTESLNLNEIYDSRFLEEPYIKNNYDLSLLNDGYNYGDVMNQTQYDFANEGLPIWAVTVDKDSTPRNRKFSYLHQFFETPPPAIYLKGKDLKPTTLPATDIQPQLQNMAPLADGSKVQRVTINTPQGDMVRVQDPKTKKFIRWENVSGESIDSEDTSTGNPTGDFPEMRRIITPPGMAYGGSLPKAQTGTEAAGQASNRLARRQQWLSRNPRNAYYTDIDEFTRANQAEEDSLNAALSTRWIDMMLDNDRRRPSSFHDPRSGINPNSPVNRFNPAPGRGSIANETIRPQRVRYETVVDSSNIPHTVRVNDYKWPETHAVYKEEIKPKMIEAKPFIIPQVDIQPQLGNIPELPIPKGSQKQRVLINTPQGDMIKVQDPKTKKFIRWEHTSGESVDFEKKPTGNATDDFPEMRRIATPPMAYGGQLPKAQNGLATAADSSFIANRASNVDNFYKNSGYDLFNTVSGKNAFEELARAREAFKTKGIPSADASNSNIKLSYDDYTNYKPGATRFEQYEITYPAINRNIARPVYDTRINPQYIKTYEGGNMGIMGETAEVAVYDKLAVTPWKKLTDKQKLKRIKEFGTSGSPYTDKASAIKELKEKLNPPKKEEIPVVEVPVIDKPVQIMGQPEDAKIPFKPDVTRRQYPIKLTGDDAIDKMIMKLYGPQGELTDNGYIPLDDPKYNPYVGGIGPTRPVRVSYGKFAEGGDISVPDLRRVKIHALPKAQTGIPADYQKFLQYSETAPENRRPDAEWQYGNPRQYDHYGMWDALGKPKNFDEALTNYPQWQPDEYDGMYHGFSTNPNTGVWLKSHIPGESHPGDTGWMEYKAFMLSNDRNWGGKNQNLVYDPELQRMRYIERKKEGGSLPMAQYGPPDWRNMLDYKNAAPPAKQNLVGDVRKVARPTAVAESTNRNVTHQIPTNTKELKAEADAQAAYDALPEAMKRQDVLTADTRSDAEKFARRGWTAISYPMATISAVNRGHDIPMGSLGMYSPYEGYDVGGPMNFLVDLVAGTPGFIVNAASRQGEQLVDDPLKYSYTMSPLGMLDPETRGQALSNTLDLSAVIPVARMAAGPLVKNTNNFLNAQPFLKDVWKNNPWRFQKNPEAYYHRTPNPANIINTEKGVLQGFGQSPEGMAYNELAIPGKGPGFVTDKGVQTGLNLRKAAHSENYFSKGAPLDWGRYNPGGSGYAGPYIAEVTGVPFVAKANGKFTKILDPVTGKWTRGVYPPSFEGGYAVPKGPVPLGNTKFYKEDWLWGYKQIGTPKSLPNKHLPLIVSGLNNFTEQKKQGGEVKRVKINALPNNWKSQ